MFEARVFIDGRIAGQDFLEPSYLFIKITDMFVIQIQMV